MNSLSKFDIYTLKLLKCLKVFCQNVIYKILKDLYYHHCKSERGNKDINKFCFEVNKKSLEKLVGGKKYFPKNFTLSYEGEDSHSDLDITMCIYLITLVIVSKDHNPDICKTDNWEALKKILQDILDIRNKLSHEDGFDMKFLNHSKMKLTENLNKISKCIGDLVIFPIKDRIQIKEEYKKICKENNKNINKLWISSGQSQLKQLMKLKEEDKYGTFISYNRQKLKEIYNPYIKSGPFLKDFNEELEIFATPKLTRKKDPASKISYKILRSDNQTNKPTFILVGDAGSGKSTICKKLVQDWCNSAKGVDTDINFDFLLVIDFKVSDENLMTYIKEVLFQDSLKDESDDDVCLLLKQLKLLFIIDDYDEKLKKSLHLFDIFNIFGNKNFIITTKPNYTANILGHFENNISYDEISVDGVEGYFELFIKQQDEISKNNVEILNSEKLLIYLKNVPTDDYCSIPLELPVFDILLIYMFKNHKKDMQEFHNLTVFHLYYMWILKLKEFNKRKLLDICNQCYKNLDSGTIDMQSPNWKVDEYRSIYLNIFKSSPTFRTGTQFEFLHKTQIEFLAAYYIADCMLQQDDKQSHTLVTFFKMNNMKDCVEKKESSVRIFLAVLEILIEENKIDIIGIKIIIAITKNFSDNYNILWKVLHEILKLDKSSWIMEIDLHYQKILPSHWELNDNNVISVVNILSYINVTPTALKVELKDDVTVPLKSSLTKLNKKKKNLLKGKSLTLIIDKETNSEVCESILKCWVHIVEMKLTAFKGCIQEQCCKVLNSCHQIGEIECRITTLETLLSFNEALGNSKWNEVQIQLDKPFEPKDELLEYIPQLNYSQVKDCKISIEFTDSKNLSLTISNLEKLKPSSAYKRIPDNLKSQVYKIILQCTLEQYYPSSAFRCSQSSIEAWSRDHKCSSTNARRSPISDLEERLKALQKDHKFTIVKLGIVELPRERNAKEKQVLKKLMEKESILKGLIEEKLILTSRIDISSSDLNMLRRELNPIEVKWETIH